MPAVGDVTSKYQTKRAVCVMTGTAAANGAPATPTAGVPTQATHSNRVAPNAADTGLGFLLRDPLYSTLVIKNTAGDAATTGTFVLWGYLECQDTWYPMKVNGGAAIAVYSGSLLRYREQLDRLGHFDRLYLELTALAGTAPVFEAYLLTGCSGSNGYAF